MISPTKADFDRAVSIPWSAHTCLVAQLMIRHGVKPELLNRKRYPVRIATINGLRELMAMFDTAYDSSDSGVINWKKLRQIRWSLPRWNWPWQKLKLP